MEGFTFAAALLLFVLLLPIIVIMFGSALAIIGPLWAPFGALACGMIARKKGLVSWRYALSGAIYSILFFWPWVYLVVRMYDRELPRFLIRLFYSLLYVTWLSAAGFMVVSAFYFFPGWDYVLAVSNPSVSLSYSLLVVGVAGVILWFASLNRLLLRHDADSLMDNNLRAVTMPHIDYMKPAAYTLAWLLVALVVLFFADPLISTLNRE